ncbi:MAG: hypothetical protein ACYDD1_05265 [Caulobacteraceae bacterium]
MQEGQWIRAQRAMAESARLVAQSDLLRKDAAKTAAETSKLMIGLGRATPLHLRRAAKAP